MTDIVFVQTPNSVIGARVNILHSIPPEVEASKPADTIYVRLTNKNGRKRFIDVRDIELDVPFEPLEAYKA